MEKQIELYLNPNGRDMWLILDLDKKQIRTIDIKTQNVIIYPFLTKKDARVNYQCWLENQATRLPSTFIVKSDEYLRPHMKSTIKELGLPIPQKELLKDYIVFHKGVNGYVFMNIENFTNSILPEITFYDINRISVQDKISKQNNTFKEVHGLHQGALV
jgi:hypothetical protein